MRVFLVWKRRCADVRAGTQAPPLRFRLARLRVGRLSLFGWIARGRLVAFGWIACKWLFGLGGIAWKNMMEIGRGGACVPARVALQGRIRRSFPVRDACIFGMETPLRRRSGGHTGAAPTVSFGDCAWDGWCRLGKCRVGIISSVARRALHICKWLRSILRAWGWNGFRAGRRPPSLCAPRISRLSFGSR